MSTYTLRPPVKHTRRQAEVTIRAIRQQHRDHGGTSKLVRSAEGHYVLTLTGASGSPAYQAASMLAKMTSLKEGVGRLEALFASLGAPHE